MFLIVGLGNPGDSYFYTRHNIGFRVLDVFVERNGGEWENNKKHNACIASLYYAGEKIVCMKPQTFMNKSGEAVASYINYYDIPIENIIIIYDDKDIEFGKIRHRLRGSSGGHNGIKSIIQYLGTEEFTRMKCGVKNEHTDKRDTADFVLSKFSVEEEKDLPEFIQATIEKIESVL